VLFEASDTPKSVGNATTSNIMDGVFGEVYRGTAPIGLTAETITLTRFDSFSFIDSFLRRTYVVVIHQDHLISFKSSEFLFHLLGEILKTDMTICICAVFLATVLTGTGFDVICNRVTSVRTVITVLTNWIFRVLGTGLGVQGIGNLVQNSKDFILIPIHFDS
jgi:hypothetical protein